MARRPLNGVPYITQVYGVENFAYRVGYHTGVDYAVPTGTPVFSPTNGVIEQNGDGRSSSDGRGFFQIIRGDDGVTHHLYHLREQSNLMGRVAEGQHTAYSNNTGLSTGPHLHWETRRGGQWFNPADWLFAPTPAPAPAPITGGNMFNNIEEVAEAYILLRGITGTESEMRPWVGQSKQRFFQVGRAEADNNRRAYKELEGQVGNLAGQVKNLTDQINDLNKRPTADQLEQLRIIADGAKEQAAKDVARAEELQKSLEDAKKETEKLQKEKQSDTETGNSFIRWIGRLFGSSK